jgi:hypothetical protein
MLINTVILNSVINYKTREVCRSAIGNFSIYCITKNLLLMRILGLLVEFVSLTFLQKLEYDIYVYIY